MKNEIQKCIVRLTNKLSESNLSECSSDFKVNKNKKAFDEFYKVLSQHIHFNNLTKKEVEELGFKLYDKEYSLWRIPLYLYPILPEGLEIKSIDNIKRIVGKDNIDPDHRSGYIAYNININNDINKVNILDKYNNLLKDGWGHIRLEIIEDEEFGKAMVEDGDGRPVSFSYNKDTGNWE